MYIAFCNTLRCIAPPHLPPCRPLDVDELNPRVLDAKYAVRGEIVLRANQIQADLNAESKNYPFDRLMYCNIGNPQALKQQPMTFIRQVEILTHYPAMMEDPAILKSFPKDAVDRAREYLAGVASTGAYTDSRGALALRQMIAKALERRDGYPADPDRIFLTDGATPCVHHSFKMLLRCVTGGGRHSVDPSRTAF